jgi:hypothetical protein
MNIFYLDENPILAAQYHVDSHVVKMILESAQMLCTAVNVKAGEQVTPYKTTHINHPCSVWVRESYGNWSYVYQLMLALQKEWRYRYKHEKTHKSVELLLDNSIWVRAIHYIGTTTNPFTPPALAMPDECKISSNPAECYREYYRKEKTHLHKWTGRDVPEWL